LEKPWKIIKSKRHANTTMPAKPWPKIEGWRGAVSRSGRGGCFRKLSLFLFSPSSSQYI